MKEGIITLLFKTQDPRYTRNYRPITLLNTDYKLLAKILAERCKRVMDKFITPSKQGLSQADKSQTILGCANSYTSVPG